MDQAFVIRPARIDDLDWLYSIAHTLGIGFTSLPNNKDFLKNRLLQVEKSFQQVLPVQERVYLFFRENLPEREIVGISGIDVNVGYRDSFYNYQISTLMQSSKSLNISIKHTMLNMVNNFQQASELISFWVNPAQRSKSVGKSLSLSRFLFMAHFPQLFNHEIIAEIRGLFDEDDNSPFWDAVGNKFFGMDFKKADELTFSSGKQFISDLVSRDPIYVELLPTAAQQVIGQEDVTAKPARKLLEQQGFKFSNHVDIFDAGPLLSVERSNIKVITECKVAIIAKLANVDDEQPALLFNNRMDARFTVAKVKVLETDQIIISKNTADILQLKIGDQLRYYFM